MGDHQVAILAARGGLSLDAPVVSDAAPLSGMLLPVVSAFGAKVRFMRDPTRGGVGVALNEAAESAGARIVLREERLPVNEPVRGVCEILGFDPLFLANEGKAILIVDAEVADGIVAMLRGHRYGRGAVVIGEVVAGSGGVHMRTAVGGERAVDYPVGDQLPRIC
jgi:hydrogenase expression/formation protein HypE